MANTQTDRPKKNILIATLGATPDIMKEALGVFCYDKEHDLYALMDPANAKDLADLRDRNAQKLGCANSVDELWLVTPDQKPAEGPAENEKKDGLEVIREWCKLYAPCALLEVKLWRLLGADDIKDELCARRFHDLMLRVMCYARNYNGGATNLMVCLAGGRKTMSADLQDAVYCFGCETLLHVLSFNQEQVGFPKPKEGERRMVINMPDGSPIDEDQVRLVKPVLLESFNMNPLFKDLVRNASFENLFNDRGAKCEAINGDMSVSIMDTCFLDKVQDIRDQAKYFYSSFTQKQEYVYDNFPILYTLSQETQDVLKRFKVGACLENKPDDLELLKTLPKSDLHCHLGGCLTVEEMVAVAATIRGKIDEEKRCNSNFQAWVPRGPKTGESWKDWRGRIADELQTDWRLVAPAYILSFENDPRKLEDIIYGDYIGPDGENDDCSFVGIAIQKKKKRPIEELVGGRDSDEVVLELTPYEILGDLQGTSLLCHEETLRKAVEILLQKSYDDGVRYLEIRCSPINYAKGKLIADRVRVVEAILDEVEAFCGKNEMRVSIMFIASRHADQERVKEGIELYQYMASEKYKRYDLFKKYFRGFDLAGNESSADPKDMRDVFEDVMQDCLNITIHAGETMPVDKIWQAVYYLNAERIGHGLTLIKDQEKLMKKFRERRIGIEMCPSSNYQVVGFRDNYYQDSLLLTKGRHLEPYPLKKYLQAHLRVSVNTDDPGISRTCMTKELLKAGRLTCEGLSLWEILSLLYNGFDTAFLPYDEKNRLLDEMNEKIRRWIEDNIKKIEVIASRRILNV